MSTEYQIILLAALVLSYPFLNWLFLNLYVTYDLKYDKEFIKYGYLSRKHLSVLSKDTFNIWCVSFLKQIGYKVPSLDTGSTGTERCIYCKNGKLDTYVLCRSLGLKNKAEDEDDYLTVGRPELQRFIGEMVHDNIQSGIVITTGDFTKEAREYVSSLPLNLAVRLIDGIELSGLYRNIARSNFSI